MIEGGEKGLMGEDMFCMGLYGFVWEGKAEGGWAFRLMRWRDGWW